ncbi:uncharacterized protein LOC144577265 [Callithrix jacchus]
MCAPDVGLTGPESQEQCLSPPPKPDVRQRLDSAQLARRGLTMPDSVPQGLLLGSCGRFCAAQTERLPAAAAAAPRPPPPNQFLPHRGEHDTRGLYDSPESEAAVAFTPPVTSVCFCACPSPVSQRPAPSAPALPLCTAFISLLAKLNSVTKPTI